jgi:hypothetical protein
LVHEIFDLVSGISTGGILSAGLTAPQSEKNPPRSTNDLIDLYVPLSREIFPRYDSHKWLGWALNGFNNLTWRYPGSVLMGYQYSAKPLEVKLNEFFSDITLSRVCVPTVITAVDPRFRKVKIFRSYRAAREVAHADIDKTTDGDFFIRDVCRATSAAPYYFPMADITSTHGKNYKLVDGGLSANNPMLIALTEAMNLFGRDRQYNLVSIGTGKIEKTFPPKEPSISLSGFKAVIDTLMDTQVDMTTNLMVSVLEAGIMTNVSYHSIEVPLDKELSAMDHSENIDLLRGIANDYTQTGEGQSKLNKVVEKIC